MTKGIVLSLYDFTGEALKPWAEAGYTCYAFDIQHDKELSPKIEKFDSGGKILYWHMDLWDSNNITKLQRMFTKDTWKAERGFKEPQVVFGMAFPVCTDLAVSGAGHFARKRKADPEFQIKASNHARWCASLFEALEIPYFIENPVSRLATLWRKPDYSFHPYEYGEYIPDVEAEHPRWPDYIAPKDRYTKKTCLWTGGGFTMPPQRPTEKPDGYSQQHLKLGGKSQRTKDIRSATPRGFARAVFEANVKEEELVCS
jgi:hypothetical protein